MMMPYLKWVNVTFGALLALAPFVFRYIGTPAALWSSLIMGAVIAVLGYLDLSKWLVGAGWVTFLAPFILRFSTLEIAMWMCIAIGASTAIVNLYDAYLSDEPYLMGETKTTDKNDELYS